MKLTLGFVLALALRCGSEGNPTGPVVHLAVDPEGAACEVSADCQPGLECLHSGLVCAAAPCPNQFCHRPCASDADCPNGTGCILSEAMAGHCRASP